VSRTARTDAVFLVAAIGATAPFVIQLAGMAGGPAGDEVRRYVGNLGKLAFLAVAALGAVKSASRLEADNPMRAAWRMMAAGLVGFAAGEVVFVVYEVLLRVPSPFPSLADAFFIASYPFLLAALMRAISAYGETGYPIGTTRERMGTAVAIGAAALLVAYPILKPVLEAPAAPLATVLNIAYPALDLALLVPVVILLRIAIRFRGGQVWLVWAGLLAGFLLMCVADVLYAYFSAMGKESLDPLVNVAFILSYAAIARGALGQYELLLH